MTRSSHGETPPGFTLYTFSRTNERTAIPKWMKDDAEARDEAVHMGAHKAVNEVTGEIVFHNETYC
jgi:hypothetical protein